MIQFDNYCKTLSLLQNAQFQNFDHDFIVEGILYCFYTELQLSLSVLKTLAIHEGFEEGFVGSPSELLKVSCGFYEFMNDEVWTSMIARRCDVLNYKYDHERAELIDLIIHDYIPAFVALRDGIKAKYQPELLAYL